MYLGFFSGLSDLFFSDVYWKKAGIGDWFPLILLEIDSKFVMLGTLNSVMLVMFQLCYS